MLLCVCCEEKEAGSNSLCPKCKEKFKEEKKQRNDTAVILRQMISFEGVDYLAEAFWDICHNPNNYEKPYAIQIAELTLTERK